MQKMRVGIVGAASLTASVLVRLLAQHKDAEITLLASETKVGKEMGEIHRELRGVTHRKFTPYNPEEIMDRCDVAFICKSHGEFLERTAELVNLAQRLKCGLKVIDLSADYRLHNPALYPAWYNFEQKNFDLLKHATYGLTEIHTKEIKKASFIANPGCYPTCVTLGVAPLFRAKVIDGNVSIVDAYSGVSGAGLRPNERNMAMNTMENILPYRVGSHPHTAEMEQELTLLAGTESKVTFTPHVASFKYGMLATIYLKLKTRMEHRAILDLYQEFYAGRPFVQFLPEGEYPEVADVVGTNVCEVGFVNDRRTETLVVMSAIDNLIKGGSGQAVQNMNLMFEREETEGLPVLR